MNGTWAFMMIEELVRHGITMFCISPGSRSAPLTIAAARHDRATTRIFHDERGAAFFALGHARATTTPAALICTSGTAAANYYPALIEAWQCGLPIIVLSADRPPELRESGANQTINQVRLFGKYAKWFVDVPCPDPEIDLAYVLNTVGDAVRHAIQVPAGPVHLNCMFREPLDWLPEEILIPHSLKHWQTNTAPWTQIEKSETYTHITEDSAHTIAASDNGLVVVGRLNGASEIDAAVKIATHLGWPLFADITTGLRSNANLKNNILHYDQLLFSKELSRQWFPQDIIHLGGPVVSKRLTQFLDSRPTHSYAHVSEGHSRVSRVSGRSTRFASSVPAWGQQLIQKVANTAEQPALAALQHLDALVGTALDKVNHLDSDVNEISVAEIVSAHLPLGSCLFLGSSMPVRDFDAFSHFHQDYVPVGSNRGASGIDGTIASALGFFNGLSKPGVLVCGDLTFLHDLSSSVLLKGHQHPVVIIVINNNGGGIFSFLPVQRQNDVFDHYFGTPHSASFSGIAEAFGLKYSNPKSNQALKHQLQEASKRGGVSLIEVVTDRDENHRMHLNVAQRIAENIEKAIVSEGLFENG